MPPASRSAEGWAFPTRFFHPNHEAILAELLAVARGPGRSPAQVAVRWVLEQPHGCQRHRRARGLPVRFRDTLGATGWRLPPRHAQRLDKVSALPHRYPRAMEETMEERRDAAVKIPVR